MTVFSFIFKFSFFFKPAPSIVSCPFNTVLSLHLSSSLKLHLWSLRLFLVFQGWWASLLHLLAKCCLGWFVTFWWTHHQVMWFFVLVLSYFPVGIFLHSGLWKFLTRLIELFCARLSRHYRDLIGSGPVFTWMSWFRILITHRWHKFRFLTCMYLVWVFLYLAVFFLFLSKDLSKNELLGLLHNLMGRSLMRVDV